MNRKRAAANKAFRSELDRRYRSFKNGSAKTYSWEEAKQAARDRVARHYSDEFKAELDRRYADYLNGEPLVSEAEVNEHIIRRIANRAKRK